MGGILSEVFPEAQGLSPELTRGLQGSEGSRAQGYSVGSCVSWGDHSSPTSRGVRAWE